MVTEVTRLPLLALLVLTLSACGGSASEDSAGDEQAPTRETTTAPAPPATEPAGSTTTKEEPKENALPGLPPFTAGYEGWTRIAKSLPPRDADPHLGTKNVFASRQPSGGAFPPGTIVVKEAVRPGADFVGLVATMRKIEGADPDHNDWVFVEYTRENASEPFGETASGPVCWSCHMGAETTDYVFVLGDTLP